jgi:hypothetical protein
VPETAIFELADPTFPRIIVSVPIDRNSLPKDPEILQPMLIDLSSRPTIN